MPTVFLKQTLFDMPGLATIIDSSLVNPGVSRSRTGESGFRTGAQIWPRFIR
jgi:hypothetical protein